MSIRLFYKPDVLDCWTLVDDANFRDWPKRFSHMKGIQYYYGLSFASDINAYCEHTDVVIEDNEAWLGIEIPYKNLPNFQYIIDNIF